MFDCNFKNDKEELLSRIKILNIALEKRNPNTHKNDIVVLKNSISIFEQYLNKIKS